MTSPSFTHDLDEGQSVLVLHGELDEPASAELRETIMKVTKLTTDLTIDLADVTFLPSPATPVEELSQLYFQVSGTRAVTRVPSERLDGPRAAQGVDDGQSSTVTDLGFQRARLGRTVPPGVADLHHQRIVVDLAGELDGAVGVGSSVRHGVGDQLVSHQRRVVAQLVGGRLVGEELQHELAGDNAGIRAVLEVLADRARPCAVAHQAHGPSSDGPTVAPAQSQAGLGGRTTTERSPSLTATTPARISSPPSSWAAAGSSCSSSHAHMTLATTSRSATNDASREPSRRPAAMPAT